MRTRTLIAFMAAACLLGCGGGGHHPTKTKLPKQAVVRFASDRPADVGPVPGPPGTGTIVASIPFDPTRDGFAFENYGFIAGPQLTPHVMRELFGNVVCADAPSERCTLTPAAQQWASAEVDSYIGGHCQGFSVTALRFFTHNLNPSQF